MAIENDPIQPLIDYIDQHPESFDERARAALIRLRELAMEDDVNPRVLECVNDWFSSTLTGDSDGMDQR